MPEQHANMKLSAQSLLISSTLLKTRLLSIWHLHIYIKSPCLFKVLGRTWNQTRQSSKTIQEHEQREDISLCQVLPDQKSRYQVPSTTSTSIHLKPMFSLQIINKSCCPVYFLHTLLDPRCSVGHGISIMNGVSHVTRCCWGLREVWGARRCRTVPSSLGHEGLAWGSSEAGSDCRWHPALLIHTSASATEPQPCGASALCCFLWVALPAPCLHTSNITYLFHG